MNRRLMTSLLLVSHAVMGLGGFVSGMYLLPILIAPDSPDNMAMMQRITNTQYVGEFQRDLKDSDFLHWGEGKLRIGHGFIAFEGKLAPGPDYKLYLSPEFVETETDFHRLKARMIRVGDVQTFDRFILPLDAAIKLEHYNTAIVWCDAFGQFISAAQFKR